MGSQRKKAEKEIIVASGDKTVDLYKKGLGRAQNVGGGTEQDYISRKRAQKKRAQALRKKKK